MVVSLTKERPQTTLNLFLAMIDDISLVIKGNGILHIVGFYEPEPEAELPFGDEDPEDEED